MFRYDLNWIYVDLKADCLDNTANYRDIKIYQPIKRQLNEEDNKAHQRVLLNILPI